MEHRPRALSRSIDRKIAGVAAGLAEYVRVDPTLVRAAWVVAAVLAPPMAVVAYLALWVIMPASTAAPLAPARGRSTADNAVLIGLVLIAIGGMLLFGQLGWVRWIAWGIANALWPSLLILAGILLLSRSRARG